MRAADCSTPGHKDLSHRRLTAAQSSSAVLDLGGTVGRHQERGRSHRDEVSDHRRADDGEDGAIRGPTSVRGRRERSRHGTGTMGSRWELDVEDEGRYLSVDFEIDSSKAGEDWRIVLKARRERLLQGCSYEAF